jgi:hypothetical protein
MVAAVDNLVLCPSRQQAAELTSLALADTSVRRSELLLAKVCEFLEASTYSNFEVAHAPASTISSIF